MDAFVSLPRSCVADNALGRAKKYIEVSGRPGPAQFHSPLYSRARDVYNLTWSVESVPKLDEIRILYRKLMVSGLLSPHTCTSTLTDFVRFSTVQAWNIASWTTLLLSVCFLGMSSYTNRIKVFPTHSCNSYFTIAYIFISAHWGTKHPSCIINTTLAHSMG